MTFLESIYFVIKSLYSRSHGPTKIDSTVRHKSLAIHLLLQSHVYCESQIWLDGDTQNE